MDYRIVQKDSFTVLGVSKTFSYENAKAEIPKFWNEFFAAGNGKYVCGMYGVNHDKDMAGRFLRLPYSRTAPLAAEVTSLAYRAR